MSYSWTCPFCQHKATIGHANESIDTHTFDDGSKYGSQGIRTHAISCPNEDCRELMLTASLHDQKPNVRGINVNGIAKQAWQLIPQSNAKVFPEYVPAPIIEDYNEACAILSLSPKASATLSRRCLQGMIRDFWAVSKRRLVDEIEAIKDKVDPVTWSAIDAVRNIGNIGAHMEADINLIIEVEPREAQLLVGLIETLISDWYVQRNDREERMKAIISIAAEKKADKNPPDA